MRRVKLRITHEKLEDLHPADLAVIMRSFRGGAAGIIASLGRRDRGRGSRRIGRALTTQIVEKLDPEKRPTFWKKWPLTRRPTFWRTCQETSEEFWMRCPAR